VCCQTFYQLSKFIRYFEVQHSSSAYPLPAIGRQAIEPREEGDELLCQTAIRRQVYDQLAQRLRAVESVIEARDPGLRSRTQADPWLDMTMWEQYLQGHDLRVIARLTEPPVSRSGLAADRYLGLILVAFDRLIEQARAIIVQGEVNVFDLHRVNNFVSRFGSIEVVTTKFEKRAMIRPLPSKLQEGTYRRYKQVWKRLICFVYRLAYQRQRQALHYTLTDPQSTALERLVAAARALSVNPAAGSDYRRGASEQQLQAELDQACLRFCITLLDHRLLGPIYDSIVIGFLAVQGIDVQNNCFYNASCYIIYLSALVKMA
jgi:hypothetical protein